jgi:hypothetical protein
MLGQCFDYVKAAFFKSFEIHHSSAILFSVLHTKDKDTTEDTRLFNLARGEALASLSLRKEFLCSLG